MAQTRIFHRTGCDSAAPRPPRPRLALMCLAAVLQASLVACSSARAPSASIHPTATPSVSATITHPTRTATFTPGSGPTLPGWNLVWDAEFTGNTLNTSQWQPVDTMVPSTVGCCVQYANQDWSPANVRVSGGALHLISVKQPQNGYIYTSGAVTTMGTYAFEYGRVDIRAKLSTTSGLWPAAWLLPVTGTSPGYSPYEIDMLEAWGSQPTTVHFFFHWPSSQLGCEAQGPNYAAGYHTYTLLWTATLIEWQVDGATDCVVTSNIPHTPMYFILSAAIDGALESTNASTILPQSFDIQYVRVWRTDA